MHDVHRDSIFGKRDQKKTRKHQAHAEESDSHGSEEHRHSSASDPKEHAHEAHAHDHDSDHANGSHNHGDGHPHHEHDDSKGHAKDHARRQHPHGHTHGHDDEEYHGHGEDTHLHKHTRDEVFGDRELGDRAFSHAHEHRHSFHHQHHHSHHPEHAGLLHKLFMDPVRDWFGVGLMALLIASGYYGWLPEHLAAGMYVCAALIGVFPVVKNALFMSAAKRRPTFELLLGVLLVAGLVSGRFLQVACISLFLLIGSFSKPNFSWKDE